MHNQKFDLLHLIETYAPIFKEDIELEPIIDLIDIIWETIYLLLDETTVLEDLLEEPGKIMTNK